MGLSRRSLVPTFLLLVTVAGVALAACGGGASSSAPERPSTRERRVAHLDRVRDAVVHGAGIEKLGVTYGPYLGMRCRHAGYGRCERVGIDVVFGHAATGVVALAGGKAIRLRTPGQHNRIRYRDWVGTFVRADFPRGDRHRDQDLVHVPVELRIHFADGRRARVLFPHVLVSSGWG